MNKNTALYNIFVGILVGGGAILPGISGGVLCLVFGVYEPLMELLAHPKTGIKKHWFMFLFFGIGYLLGFLIFAVMIRALFEVSETLATWLVIGLLAGMFPSLYKDSNKTAVKGKNKFGIIAMVCGFLVYGGTVLPARLNLLGEITPGFWAFVFCGVLWGISFVIPGMTSSATLMALGLFLPLTDGIMKIDFSVILPWLVGLLGTVLLTARLINWLFTTHRTIMYRFVFGVAVASTLVIIPVKYISVLEGILSAVCFGLGLLGALYSAKLEEKYKQ